MEKTCVEDELTFTVTTESKRQKICKPLEEYKADSFKMLTSLHDHLEKLESDIGKRSREFELKEKQLGEAQKLIEGKTNELEEKVREMKAADIEAGDKEKELDLLRNEIKSVEKTLIELKESVKNTQRELKERLREIKAVEIESVDKEKKLDLLRNQIKSEEKTLIELRESVKKTQNELVLRNNELSQMNVAAETELFNGDALMIPEISLASLSRCKVSSYLKAAPNPAEFVLDLVEGEITGAYQRKELGLEDLVVENLCLFLKKLIKIGGLNKSQLQLKATQVATLWKGMIIIEAPRSSLEALAFMLFIVAYELKSLINDEETALLASSVFHYKLGPTICRSLGIKHKIPDLIRGLIEDRQYIPAVRLICLFKRKDFSATTLLMKELSELRRSAMEKAENRDVGKMRAIVELVVDYKLDIDLPADLVAKLLLQRENSTPPVLHCSFRAPNNTCAFSSNPVAATRSSVDLLVPKHETKPFVNPSVNGDLHCPVKARDKTCTSSSNPKATSSHDAATHSRMDLQVPKCEIRPFLSPSASGRL